MAKPRSVQPRPSPEAQGRATQPPLMNVFLLIAILASINIALGFAGATLLGRRCGADPSEPDEDFLDDSFAADLLAPRPPAAPEDDNPPSDSESEPAARETLESTLSDWCQSDPSGMRDLSLAMIDLDDFAQVNEQFGRELADAALAAVAKLLAAEGGKSALTAKFSGQRFVVLMPEADHRAAATIVERMRQSIEAASFVHNDQRLPISVSCGVAAMIPQDAVDKLFSRAEQALQEAKRFGRNRTYLHDGRQTTPIAPPSISVDERTIALSLANSPSPAAASHP